MHIGVQIERVVGRGNDPAAHDDDVEVAFARALAAFVADAAADATGAAERRLRELVSDLPVHLARIDAEGVFVASFGGALARVGLADDELVGHTVPIAERAVSLDLAGGEPAVVDVEVRAGHDRRTFTAVLVPQPDGVVVAVSVDATGRRDAAERLRESHDRTRAILDAAADGIITCDADARVVDFNAAAERMLGYDAASVVGTEARDLIAPDQRDLVMEWFVDRLGGPDARGADEPPREVHALRRDGTTIPVELSAAAVTTSLGRFYTAVVHDVSERRAFQLELEHQATHDALTGLPNRALLTAQLEDALRRANRHRSSVGVLFVELDRVKIVTDTLGHRAGDELIVEAARRLERAVGDRGTVTRFAGERFVVYCDEVDDVSQAVDCARLVLNAIDRPFRVGAEEAFLSASIGIAFAVLGLSSAETLISNADVAMYRAKERGSPRFEVFDAEMRARVDSRRRLEIALRHGIDRDEFELAYQPIVALEHGRIVGFEALVRWNHPLLGQLPPNEFIPVAEDSGLILQLGELLLAEACDRLAAWQERHPDLFVSVNLSGRQLAQPDLVDVVERCLARAGATPSGLHIELTETVLLRDVDAAVRRLQHLRRTGVKLSLDDFGTGYSSLSYLTRFPIDVVKIDRSFVSQLGIDDRDSSVVTMIVNMARTLGLEAVAEGVESETQLRVLRELGCTLAQGYLFAKPQSAVDAEGML